jgi:hypothetical protein
MTVLLTANTASAYICDKDASGPLSVIIEKTPKITEIGKPQTVKAVFKNSSTDAVSVSIFVKSIEQIKTAASASKALVPAHGTAEIAIQVECGEGTLSAHYPIHLFADFEINGVKYQLHPVQVFETDFGAAGLGKLIAGKSQTGREIAAGELIDVPQQLPVVVVPQQGGVSLASNRAYRVTWRQFQHENENHILNVGWQGSDEMSQASFVKTRMIRGGISRESFSVHPPYNGGAGTIFTEQLVQFPDTKPILFSAYLAMRDISPTEPESDGVTFAVWVGNEKIGEKHTISKTWEPFQADLSKFAGQTVLLRLESHPGQQHDTTCDNAFWGTPLIFAGEPSKILTKEEKNKLLSIAIRDQNKPLQGNHSFEFYPDTNSSASSTAIVTFGNYGFLDGLVTIAGVVFDGLRVDVDDQPLGTELSTLSYGKWESVTLQNGEKDSFGQPKLLQYKQKVFSNGRELEMLYTLKNCGIALQLGVECSEPAAVTKVAFGPVVHDKTHQGHANRVYFGHGYCITEPERFETGSGGHNLSTSHVGFDFDNGQSLLMATTFPPQNFIVDPENHVYTLNVAYSTTLTLLPGSKNALDCAIRYRPLYDKKSSAGVAKKMGRFVFDVWDGYFAEHTKKLQQQIDYGATDSLFINHNWQRWGYDNRLPDIWTPNPQRGTKEELQETLDLCKKHGMLYGVHDNYIDIYPDADDFNYDVVSFEENNRPRKAWNNYGIDAQSYQLRPDCLMPFLNRNLELMKRDGFLQTAYFVDVFASIDLRDFWERNGVKHSRAEMLEHWCKAFDQIREHLGDDNPTVSEAGDDFLIGRLDGADCQFLMLSPEPGDFRINIKCKEWSRVPWFDAVNHTRFSLHGVGYDSRYAANRGYDLHGYMSDDYISTEILTGHSLQVGYNNIGRDSVRKYWLAQPIAKAISRSEIHETIVRDNYGDMEIRWYPNNDDKMNTENNNRIQVIVNQTKAITPHTSSSGKLRVFFPQYGYEATNPDGTIRSAVLGVNVYSPNDGKLFASPIVEFSSNVINGERQIYFNPRQVGTNALPTMPTVKHFQKIGENQFQLVIDWNVFRSLKERKDVKNYHWFLHLEKPRRNWHERLESISIGGGLPEVPVSQWETSQQTESGNIQISEQIVSGTYNVLVGLWDADGDKKRVKLLGPTPDNSRILLGKLKVEKRGNTATKLDFIPENEDSPELFARLLPTQQNVLDAIVASETPPLQLKTILQIPLCSTGGVQLRCPKDAAQRETFEMTVTPLPEEPASAVVINVNGTPNSLIPNVKNVQCDSLIAVDSIGKKLRDVPFKIENNELRFNSIAGEFAYKIVVKK